MLQVGRNLINPWTGFLNSSRFLIHDRATVFSERFSELLRSAKVESLRLPARSPNLNAYAERFVRTIREECLDSDDLLRRRVSAARCGGICRSL